MQADEMDLQRLEADLPVQDILRFRLLAEEADSLARQQSAGKRCNIGCHTHHFQRCYTAIHIQDSSAICSEFSCTRFASIPFLLNKLWLNQVGLCLLISVIVLSIKACPRRTQV